MNDDDNDFSKDMRLMKKLKRGEVIIRMLLIQNLYHEKFFALIIASLIDF